MTKGRTQKAVKNVVFNFVNQVVTLLLAFVSRTVFIWGFGVEYLGINGLFSDVLGLLSMADLGFGTAMVYSFYRPLAEKDYQKMAALTSFYKKIYTAIAIGVAVIGIALMPALPYIINLETQISNINIYYLLSLANIVFSYLCVYKTSILNADQKAYKVTKITMQINIIKTLIQIISIFVWKNYIVYLVIGCVSVLLNNIIASQVAAKEYPFIQEKADLSREQKGDIFRNIGSVFLYKVSSVLLNTTDNLLISIIVGTVAVGYYSNYLMLQNKISLFYTMLFTSLTASIGNLIVNEKAEKRYEIFECEQSVSFIVCGVVIPCYVLLANDLIKVWLGAEYVLANEIVAIIGLNMYLSCVLQPLWSYREATGLYRKTKWVMVACAFLNLVLSVCLGKLMGIAGILLASALARLLTYVWYEPKLLFKEYFSISPQKYYLQMLGNLTLILIIVVITGKIGRLIIVDNIVLWLMKACCIGVCSLVIVLLVYIRSEGVKILCQKVKVYLNKRSKIGK